MNIALTSALSENPEILIAIVTLVSLVSSVIGGIAVFTYGVWKESGTRKREALMNALNNFYIPFIRFVMESLIGKSSSYRFLDAQKKETFKNYLYQNFHILNATTQNKIISFFFNSPAADYALDNLKYEERNPATLKNIDNVDNLFQEIINELIKSYKNICKELGHDEPNFPEFKTIGAKISIR